MVETRQLTKRYDNLTAVDRLSFRVEEGQTLALIGPSGCGKTTTLKMINRLITPSEGEVFVNGQNVMDQALEPMRRGMGYVIQNIGLFPHYTALENIGLVPQLLGWPKERIRRRSLALLDQLGLPPADYADKYPSQLSGGQQQRIGIARALAAEPPIILMDEPFGALDPLTRQQVRRDFMELEELQNKTIVMVTHDIEEAFEMGSLICLLHEGCIEQLGPPESLLLEPASSFVEAFLAEKAAQLELRAIRLKDIFDQLPQRAAPADGTLGLPASLPLLRAIYRLAKEQRRYAYGRVELGGQQRWVTLDELFSLFRQSFKKWNR